MTDDKSLTTQHVIHIPRQIKSGDVLRVPSSAAHVLVHLEAGSEAVVCLFVAPGCSVSKMDVLLEQGARLELLRVIDPGAGISCESSLQVRQAADSSLRSFFVTKGSLGVHDLINVLLEGQGAEVFLNGLHHLAKDAEAGSVTFIDHAAPSTTSNQLYKSILRDKAHSIFNGKIMVRREAQLTNAYQLNKNLLLSPEARVDTKPQLEIFADDVKCSHGAAIGQLDDEQMFYLQTRGLDRKTAGEMLVHGFVEDVLDQIKDARLREEVEAVLNKGVSHV
jgi:Fe-S cluster assembly protein SufD